MEFFAADHYKTAARTSRDFCRFRKVLQNRSENDTNTKLSKNV